MDTSKKRRIAGAAAVSATALASLLGAQPAVARETPPPGLIQACQTRPHGDDPSTLAFKQGFPIKWQGALRCDAPDDGAVYDWWKKIET
jgi:hypothetical protein